MKNLNTYLEELATPANTIGMGNPGEIAPGMLSEPVMTVTAKAICQNEKKKKKKKQLKESLFDFNRTQTTTESLFDKDLSNKNLCYKDIYEIAGIEGATLGDDSLACMALRKRYGDTGLYMQLRHKNSTLKKITKPVAKELEEDYKLSRQPMYLYDPNLFYLSQLILCCHNDKEIVDYLTELLDSIPQKNILKVDEYDWQRTLNHFEIHVLDTLGRKKGKMVVIKLFTNDHAFDSVIWIKLKPKDM